MSNPRRDNEYLLDISESIRRISILVSGLTFDSFLEDWKTQDAVIRNLQVIGEATKKVSLRIRKQNQNIPWKEMAGIRDKIIHDYFGINYDVIWTVVIDELPELAKAIKNILIEDE
jgi:uncharacterized protein with HEPN domain